MILFNINMYRYFILLIKIIVVLEYIFKIFDKKKTDFNIPIDIM